jgi:hypothetical protein
VVAAGAQVAQPPLAVRARAAGGRAAPVRPRAVGAGARVAPPRVVAAEVAAAAAVPSRGVRSW